VSDSETVTGGCLCGAIRYELNQSVDNIIQCHCTDCQKGSGAGFSPNTPVSTDNFKIIQGSPKAFSKVVDSGRTLHRHFCGDCGSPLFSRRENSPEMTILRLGSLDASAHAKVVMNIWTDSAQAWTEWDDSLPSHAQNRPT